MFHWIFIYAWFSHFKDWKWRLFFTRFHETRTSSILSLFIDNHDAMFQMKLKSNSSFLKWTTWNRKDETFMSTSTKQTKHSKQAVASNWSSNIFQNFFFSASSRLLKLIIINTFQYDLNASLRFIWKLLDDNASLLSQSISFEFFKTSTTYIQNDFDEFKCKRMTRSNHKFHDFIDFIWFQSMSALFADIKFVERWNNSNAKHRFPEMLIWFTIFERSNTQWYDFFWLTN